MKTCTKCQREQPEENFHLRSRATGKRSSWCRDCMNAASAKHYLRNRVYLAYYLSTHPCVECGERDPLVLEFDHIELRGPDDLPVSALTNASRKRIDEEIAKCQILCANCHTRKTRLQMGWRNYTMLVEVVPG